MILECPECGHRTTLLGAQDVGGSRPPIEPGPSQQAPAPPQSPPQAGYSCPCTNPKGDCSHANQPCWSPVWDNRNDPLTEQKNRPRFKCKFNGCSWRSWDPHEFDES